MFSYPSGQFKKVKSIYGVFAVTNVATSKAVANRPCTVVCMSGNVWVNPLTTAVADATAIKLVAGMQIDMSVYSAVSLISDVDGGTAQVIVWEE